MPISDVSVTNSAGRRRYETLVEQATVAGFVEYQETSELAGCAPDQANPEHR